MRPQPLSGEYPTGGVARTTPPECKRCVQVLEVEIVSGGAGMSGGDGGWAGFVG